MSLKATTRLAFLQQQRDQKCHPNQQQIGGDLTMKAKSLTTMERGNGSNNSSSRMESRLNHYHEIIPLKKYPHLLRLDVLPFLILYTILIALDSGLLLHSKEVMKWTHLVLFPLALGAQVALFLASQWNISVQARIGYKQCDKKNTTRKGDFDVESWTHCLVKPPVVATNETWNDSGDPDEYKVRKSSKNQKVTNRGTVTSVGRIEIVPVRVKKVKSNFVVAAISYEETVFRYCVEKGSSLPLGSDEEMDSIWHVDTNMSLHSAPKSISMDRHSSDDQTCNTDSSSISTQAVFHRLHYPIDLPLSFYTNHWIGHSIRSLQAVRRVYSDNRILIHLPPFVDLLSQQLLAPFFLFQLLCVLLWCLDEYWYYALFTLFTLVLFECTVAHSRLKNLQRLRETLRPPFGVWVYRGVKRNDRQKENNERQSKWQVVPSQELVVGDIISLSASSSLHEDGTHIPADLLLLRGNAVLNEAMLTGESIPQMKEPLDIVASALSYEEGAKMEPHLDIEDSTYKRAILFGGTVLMNCSTSTNTSDAMHEDITETYNKSSRIPSSPEGGCLALVLRTGFDTQQGSLLRNMVHTSTKSQNDGVNTKDTFMFIVILLLCAVISSGYVLHHGWSDPNRNRFKLILHVIIIITSVVPPELPMELSLAVTSSLADLVKRCAVYCTEPFRIPLAGMVDTCCFDKTGTLTSDEMLMRGVRLPIRTCSDGGSSSTTLKMSATLVEPLGSFGGGILGDDGYDNGTSSCIPHEVLRVLVGCQSLAPGSPTKPHSHGLVGDGAGFTLIGDPLEKAVLKATEWRMLANDTVAPPDKMNIGSDCSKQIHILHRFAFTSKLKRMTVIAHDLGEPNLTWALSKGAPETMKGLFDPSSIPDAYDTVSKHHMSLGQRVLAIGYKRGTKSQASVWKKGGRQSLERHLIFAGFLVLDCPLKPDSKKVIKELRNSGHQTVMITGDAIATAAEVARQVGIIKTKGKRNSHTYELRETTDSLKNSHRNDLTARFIFVPIASDDTNFDSEKCIAYSHSNLNVLKEMLETSSIAAICVTGDTLTKIAADVVNRKMRDKSKLRGHNVPSPVDPKTILFHPDAQSALQALVPLISVFARHAPRQKEAVIAAFNGAGRITLMCGDGTNDVGALKMSHCGISIISVPDIEAKQRDALDGILRLQDENKCKKTKKKVKKTSQRKKSKTLEQRLQSLAEAEEELNNVALGDASVASPFTSRATSIKCTTDVLQRGRCTLVTMMQIYKILGVNCLVNALVLSSLHLVGAKQGDTQLTVVGLVVAGLFFFVTKSQPLNKLSPQRPPSTVLCTQVLLSVAVQFLVHFVCIMAISSLSKSYLDPYDPSLVPDAHFNPNTLNSATFIMTVLATVNTFVVNYCGRPFMEDLRENKMMVRALQLCYGVLFASVFEVFPPLNEIMQLAPLPIDGEFKENISSNDRLGFQLNQLHLITGLVGFKITLCALMLVDTLLSYTLEKLLVKAFPLKNMVAQ